jgi:hypothetical protein
MQRHSLEKATFPLAAAAAAAANAPAGEAAVLLLLLTGKISLLWSIAKESVAVLVLWDVSLPEQLHAQQLRVEVNVLLQAAAKHRVLAGRTPLTWQQLVIGW